MDKIIGAVQEHARLIETIGLMCSLVPFLIAIICTALWWRRLANPRFFLLMATLAMCGLFGWLRWSLYMLQRTIKPDFLGQMDMAKRFVWNEVIASGGAALLIVFLGVLLLHAAMRLQAQPAPLVRK